MESIMYKGVWLNVQYSYSSGEKQVMYYPDGSGYPGSSAMVEIDKIFIEGIDCTELLEDQLPDIEELILKAIED